MKITCFTTWCFAVGKSSSHFHHSGITFYSRSVECFVAVIKTLLKLLASRSQGFKSIISLKSHKRKFHVSIYRQGHHLVCKIFASPQSNPIHFSGNLSSPHSHQFYHPPSLVAIFCNQLSYQPAHLWFCGANRSTHRELEHAETESVQLNEVSTRDQN